jgi:micrococcal nuclease
MITEFASKDESPWIYVAHLHRVIDGDTLDLTVDLGFSITVTKRFRLLDVDAPEIRTLDLDEKHRGLVAKAEVESLFEIYNNKCYISTWQKKCKFGRYLAHIYLDPSLDESLSEYLIAHDLASKYSQYISVD